MTTCPICHNLLEDGATKCSRCAQSAGSGRIGDELPQADLTGQVVGQGRYEVKSLLGAGGMGSVYKASDTRLRRDVALKVLNPELIAHPTARRRMTQEAEALARIEHPNVVRVLDIFDEGASLAMVLEFVTGGDLEAKIRPGGLPESEVVTLMIGILGGLDAIHEAGLVHRDMKPANVLLSGKGVPKITDLGVARDSQAKEKTRLGATLGTPEYMSPEQIQGFAVDARSDIYACGIVMYELLTGHKPYHATSDFEIASAHVRTPPNLAVLEGKVGAGVIGVVSTALAKVPADRFGSATEMAEELLRPGGHASAGADAWPPRRAVEEAVGGLQPQPIAQGNRVATQSVVPAPIQRPAATTTSGPYRIDAAADTVLDSRTGFTWQRTTDGKDYTWQQAKDYCAALALAGGGWRLPTKLELEKLFERGKRPTIDETAFPGTPTEWFWSATPFQHSSSGAWGVNFVHGYSGCSGITYRYRVRCVR